MMNFAFLEKDADQLEDEYEAYEAVNSENILALHRTGNFDYFIVSIVSLNVFVALMLFVNISIH